MKSVCIMKYVFVESMHTAYRTLNLYCNFD